MFRARRVPAVTMEFKQRMAASPDITVTRYHQYQIDGHVEGTKCSVPGLCNVMKTSSYYMDIRTPHNRHIEPDQS